MKIISVCGITQSGKTTTIENIISELVRRGYKVGSVKEIHYELFKIDTEGSNTDRHKNAGSQLVVARGYFETDVLYQENLNIKAIIDHFDDSFDYLVLEGVSDAAVPVIVTAHTEEDAKEKWSDYTIALSGRMSVGREELWGKPAINALTDVEKLVDLIELKTFHKLPYLPKECCNACGYSCETFAVELINKKKKESDCAVKNPKISVKVDGKELQMAPFVQDIVKNTVLSVIQELEGYEEGKSLEIHLG